MYDTVIKGGKVVDGSGAKAFISDIAVKDGKIAEISPNIQQEAKQIIDAKGKVVTPGFVDIHTHYDGQVTWDSDLAPSLYHGVTTLVMGNCGVGFAPAKVDKRDWLIGLMEGVEDIPGSALSEGMKWEWESFPEYLDALDKRKFTMDVATQIPHGALRAYVMGERGAFNEPATAEDIQAMSNLTQEALEAGALGFSTSRTLAHRAIDGEPVPGTFAAEDELFGIGQALARTGKGVFELAPAGIVGEDLAAPDREIDWMKRLSAEVERPVSFILVQNNKASDQWREQLDYCARAIDSGIGLYPQVASRGNGLLLGFQSVHPFLFKPTYQAIAHLPLHERIQELRKPKVKQSILNEDVENAPPMFEMVTEGLHRAFKVGTPPNYEPEQEDSIFEIAKRAGKDSMEVLYDTMLLRDGQELVMLFALNYSDGNLDAVYEMLRHPSTVFGLGDGGAHCSVICDASMTTFMLNYWVRDRAKARLELEFAVHKMTQQTAELYGLYDRGLLKSGYRADINIIDFDELQLDAPKIVNDLPTEAARMLQGAKGYDMTMVLGQQIRVNGETTGNLPGRLLRGRQNAPC